MLKEEEWIQTYQIQLLTIPTHMHGALARYVLYGIHPGSFLFAVLSNDLRKAVNCADDKNKVALVCWIQFLTWNLPAIAWGDPQSVYAWIDGGYMRHQEKSATPSAVST